MKKLSLVLLGMVICSILFSQSPSNFNYQAVLRDASGNVMSDQSVVVDIAILQSDLVTVVFNESHNITTTNLGLINLSIGSISDLSIVDWAADDYFIRVSVNGKVVSTSQLLSVPYALHAKTADKTLGDSLWKQTTDNIYYMGGRVGIGTLKTTAQLSVFGEDLPTAADSRSDWLRLYGSTVNHDNLHIFHRRYIDGTDWNSTEVVIQKQVDSSPMHYISFKGLTGNDSRLDIGYSNIPYMTMNKIGYVGINTQTPTKPLEVNGSVKFGSDMSLWNGNKALNFRQDDNNSWIINIADFLGNGTESNGMLNIVGENGITLRYGLGTGAGTPGLVLKNTGNVGIGNIDPGNFGLSVDENKDVRFGHYINIADYDHEDADAQLISRDGNLHIWTGGLVVGRYANGLLPSIGYGNLLVENNVLVYGNIGVGKNASYKIDVSGTVKGQYNGTGSIGYLGRSNYGVEGSSSHTGVFGNGTTIGVRGNSNTGTGVLGQSITGLAGHFDGDVKVEDELEVVGSIKLGTFGVDSMIVISGSTVNTGPADFALPEGWNFENTFVINCLFEDKSAFNSSLNTMEPPNYGKWYYRTTVVMPNELPPIPHYDGSHYEICHFGGTSYAFRVYVKNSSPIGDGTGYSAKEFKAILMKIN